MAVGTIAYCSREDHVAPVFATCLARLLQRHPDAFLLHAIGTNIADQRNQVVRELQGDWVWFIDSDMVFAADTLTALLARNVPVVQTLCVNRHPPHEPILHTATAARRDAAPVGTPRLVEVEAVGSGGTLYRREVFATIPAPWFEGVLGTEDMTFARKLKAAGVLLYCDLAVPVGHLTPTIVWPRYEGDGTWGIRYQAMNGLAIQLPRMTPPGLVEVPALTIS